MFKDVDFDIVKIIIDDTEYDFEPRENMSKLLPTPVPGLPKCINDIKSDNTEPFTDKDYLYIIAAEKGSIHKNDDCNYDYFVMSAVSGDKGIQPPLRLEEYITTASNYQCVLADSFEISNFNSLNDYYRNASLIYIVDPNANRSAIDDFANIINHSTYRLSIKHELELAVTTQNFKIIMDFTDNLT